jgi:L-amino acid N-acyltransferase YncA
VVELDKYLVTYLDVIKTKEGAQRKGLGSQFVRDLVEFLEQ